MHNQPFKLADLIALQAENAAAQPRLKSVTEIKKPTLDQIEIFPSEFTPAKKRGGYRGAHRRKGEGSTVVRIPNELLDAVTAMIDAYKTPPPPVLNVVTELKSRGFYDAYIKEGATTQIWSGRGRKPLWLQNLPRGDSIERYRNPNPSQPIRTRDFLEQ